MTLVEGSINNQISLIIYGGPNTLAETSSEPCLIEVPPNHSTMSQGNDMWMAASLATDFDGWTPLPTTGPSTGVHRHPHEAPHLHGLLSCLVLSLFHSCSCLCPVACCPMFHLPSAASHMSSSSHVVW